MKNTISLSLGIDSINGWGNEFVIIAFKSEYARDRWIGKASDRRDPISEKVAVARMEGHLAKEIPDRRRGENCYIGKTHEENLVSIATCLGNVEDLPDGACTAPVLLSR